MVETLKETGQYENTVIIITSDNGPVLFDGYWESAIESNGNHTPAGPWRGGKYSRWEGGTRVPLIVSWPKKTSPCVSDAIISQVDLYASIASLIKEAMPENAGKDGKNLLSALLGKTQQGREYVIQEALTQIAVRKDNWKYIPPGSITERGGIGIWHKKTVAEPGMLFYLTEDPSESNNLAAKYPEKVKELRQVIMNVAPEKLTGGKKLDKKQLGF